MSIFCCKWPNIWGDIRWWCQNDILHDAEMHLLHLSHCITPNCQNVYCLGPVLVTPPVHVTQGSSIPLQSISPILFATYIDYILSSYSLWVLRLSWMFLSKLLLFQEPIWCKFRGFEFFCTPFKYFWNQVAYMAP